MRTSVIAIGLFLYFNSTFAQEEYIQKVTQRYGIPGIQLVCVQGKKEQSINVGTISKGSDKKVTAHTVFEAASLSKCVFAYAVLRLYDRGVISLDTPLINYIGTYERFDPHDSRYAKITARMVLRHTTGLPNWGNDTVAKLIFTPDSVYSY
jgi:CubicO group peptidase (beta-lactamase class C family)